MAAIETTALPKEPLMIGAILASLLSPNFFLDTPGCVAKISTSALQDFNADVVVFGSPNSLLKNSPGEGTGP